jgi:hypothetical protein
MKIKCTALAEEMGMEIEQLLAQAAKVIRPGMSTGKGKNTWFTEDGADIVSRMSMCLETCNAERFASAHSYSIRASCIVCILVVIARLNTPCDMLRAHLKLA